MVEYLTDSVLTLNDTIKLIIIFIIIIGNVYIITCSDYFTKWPEAIGSLPHLWEEILMCHYMTANIQVSKFRFVMSYKTI